MYFLGTVYYATSAYRSTPNTLEYCCRSSICPKGFPPRDSGLNHLSSAGPSSFRLKHADLNIVFPRFRELRSPHGPGTRPRFYRHCCGEAEAGELPRLQHASSARHGMLQGRLFPTHSPQVAPPMVPRHSRVRLRCVTLSWAHAE